MKIDVSNGELVDKVTILQIKLDNINDPIKLQNVQNELDILLEPCNSFLSVEGFTVLMDKLKNVNLQLWNIEDEIREKERLNEFDDKFIELARNVYKTNDLRANIKKKINELTNSYLTEEKSYSEY